MAVFARRLMGWGAALLVASVVLVSVAWMTRGQARVIVDSLVDPLYIPAMTLAIWLSPSPHDFSAALLFGAYVVQTFLMLAAVAALVALLRLASRRTRT